jgi:hypothetical protein
MCIRAKISTIPIASCFFNLTKHLLTLPLTKQKCYLHTFFKQKYNIYIIGDTPIIYKFKIKVILQNKRKSCQNYVRARYNVNNIAIKIQKNTHIKRETCLNSIYFVSML